MSKGARNEPSKWSYLKQMWFSRRTIISINSDAPRKTFANAVSLFSRVCLDLSCPSVMQNWPWSVCTRAVNPNVHSLTLLFIRHGWTSVCMVECRQGLFCLFLLFFCFVLFFVLGLCYFVSERPCELCWSFLFDVWSPSHSTSHSLVYLKHERRV